MIRRPLITSIAALAAACGGARTLPLTPTDKATGAEGTLQAHPVEEQHLTKVEMEVHHLPPPEKVAGASTHFVAWYRKDASNVWVRLGALEYDQGARKGKLAATAPEMQFDVSVSVERVAAPPTPSTSIVLQQTVKP